MPWQEFVAAYQIAMRAVMGADALDRVIEDQCHRPLRVAALVGCSPYQRLTPERAAHLLLDPDGSRRHVAPGVRFSVVLTKVSETRREVASQVVAELVRSDPDINVVVVADIYQQQDQ